MANYIPAINVPNRAPDFAVHGAEVTAPAAAAVLVTSGGLPSPSPVSRVLVVARIQGDATSSGPTFEVAHRNAANTADLEVSYISAASVSGDWWGIFSLQSPGESVIVRVKATGTDTGDIYQVDIYGWRF